MERVLVKFNTQAEAQAFAEGICWDDGDDKFTGVDVTPCSDKRGWCVRFHDNEAYMEDDGPGEILIEDKRTPA